MFILLFKFSYVFKLFFFFGPFAWHAGSGILVFPTRDGTCTLYPLQWKRGLNHGPPGKSQHFTILKIEKKFFLFYQCLYGPY